MVFRFTQINSIELNFISSENSKLFFSKTFNIGFRAEHIILTYNADKSDDAVSRFAVAGEETTDISKYQYINPNMMQELYSIPLYSDKIKLMMELAGDSGIPIKVHEISFMFSGEKYDRINIETVLSTSSTSSFSSSSSSLDSSQANLQCQHLPVDGTATWTDVFIYPFATGISITRNNV